MTTTLNRPARWWDDYADMLGPAFTGRIAVEDTCRLIRTYETVLVPGLLQTPEYARAVMEAAGAEAGLVERGVRLRLARQQVLSPDRGVRLEAAVDEGVLVRAAQTDTGQLAALLGWARRPNVTVRVVPFAYGPFGAGQAPFSILYPPEGGALGYGETPEGSFVSEATGEPWESLFAAVWEAAAGEEESAALIRRAVQG